MILLQSLGRAQLADTYSPYAGLINEKLCPHHVKFFQGKTMSQKQLALLALLFAMPCFAENLPYERAKEAGVVKCLPAIQKVSQFLHGGASYGAHSTWSANDADQQMFATTIEKTYSDGSQIISMIVAPVPSGACATAYERIVYSEKSCIAMVKEVYTDFEYKGELNKSVTYLKKKDGGGSVYLMPAGNGCISVRTEMLLDGNNL